MCTVSMVGDYYGQKYQGMTYLVSGGGSREEFDALKADVAEMTELLVAAKRIDELTGQPDCEMDEKLRVLRRVAELVGIDLEDVLTPKP